jgi:hypothetical protein
VESAPKGDGQMRRRDKSGRKENEEKKKNLLFPFSNRLLRVFAQSPLLSLSSFSLSFAENHHAFVTQERLRLL